MRTPYHLATPTNWAPFAAAELPPELRNDLRDILAPFYLATLELTRTVCRYELLVAIGRDRNFVKKIHGTTVAPAMNTIKGSLNTSIVMSLCAIFDPDAVSLQAIMNRILRPEYVDAFRAAHKGSVRGLDTDQQRDRLFRLQRRLKRGMAGKSLARVADLRNQIVAHLDTEAEFGDGYPNGRDMAILLAAAANILVSLARFVFLDREIVVPIVRRNSRLQAQGFVQAIRPSNFGRITDPNLVGTFFSPGLHSPIQDN
jgi:hypothetical protein